jgi:hypothetical protein
VSFFIIFITSPVLATKLWVVLVLYAQGVVLLLFVWQLSWTESTEESHPILNTIVGLKHFENLWLDTVWNLIIVIFAVIQWNVNLVSIRNESYKKLYWFFWPIYFKI